MAINLRELAESDLSISLEGDFGLPVELIDPDGVKYDGISGQVLFDVESVNPETLEVTVIERIVSLRRSTLTRIPLDGERWVVRIPTTPSTTAELEDFVLSEDRPSSGGASIGFIKLYPERIAQTA